MHSTEAEAEAWACDRYRNLEEIRARAFSASPDCDRCWDWVQDAEADMRAMLGEIDRLKTALAAAWDQGFDAAEDREDRAQWSPAHDPRPANPYRATPASAEAT